MVLELYISYLIL